MSFARCAETISHLLGIPLHLRKGRHALRWMSTVSDSLRIERERDVVEFLHRQEGVSRER